MVEAIWDNLLELAPWLLLGALAAGVLQALLPADFLRRHLSGRWGVLKAAAFGVPMSLCSCAVIPMGMSLRRQGASVGATVAFLITTPETGIDALFVNAGFLGWQFAFFKLCSAVVIGIVGGVLADKLVAPTDEVADQTAAAGAIGHRSVMRGILTHAIELLRSLWGWLAIGVVASAAIAHWLPADGLARFNAYGGAGAMVIALIIGMPLYVCATASVPIAAALVRGGFPPGAALVFLIAGPATNVTTMGAVYRVLGRRTLVIYLTTIAVGSIACGLAFDWLVEFDRHAVHGHAHEHAPALWAVASAVVLLGLAAKFAWDDLATWRRSRQVNVTAESEAVEVDVGGMTCGNCVARLERVLSREAGVAGARVTLEPGRAVVYGEVSEPRVRELIAQAGFEPR